MKTLAALILTAFLTTAAHAGFCNQTQQTACNFFCEVVMAEQQYNFATCTTTQQYSCWDSIPGHIQCGYRRLVSCACSYVDPGIHPPDTPNGMNNENGGLGHYAVYSQDPNDIQVLVEGDDLDGDGLIDQAME